MSYYVALWDRYGKHLPPSAFVKVTGKALDNLFQRCLEREKELLERVNELQQREKNWMDYAMNLQYKNSSSAEVNKTVVKSAEQRLCDRLEVELAQKDAQIAQKDAQIARLLSALARISAVDDVPATMASRKLVRRAIVEGVSSALAQRNAKVCDEGEQGDSFSV